MRLTDLVTELLPGLVVTLVTIVAGSRLAAVVYHWAASYDTEHQPQQAEAERARLVAEAMAELDAMDGGL